MLGTPSILYVGILYVFFSPPSLGSGLEKGVFWKRGLFRKVHFLEILEILENPQTLEN